MIDRVAFSSAFANFDVKVLAEVIAIYIEEHPIKMNQLEKSLQVRDFKMIRGVAHNLKGILSQFYATEACQHARELELMAKELTEYQNGKSSAVFNEACISIVKKMIDKLKNSSLQVINDLKEIEASGI